MAGRRGVLKQRVVRARSEPALEGHVQRIMYPQRLIIGGSLHRYETCSGQGPLFPSLTGSFKIARTCVVGAIVFCGHVFDSVLKLRPECPIAN